MSNQLPNLTDFTETVSLWTHHEHERLHGPGTSLLSDLEKMRRATSLDYMDPNNIPVQKATQHLQRLASRAGNLIAAEFEPDFTGRAVSDCLKLVAGQQVKRALASASDKGDFVKILLAPDDDIQALIDDAAMPVPSITDDVFMQDELEILGAALDTSWRTINHRAILGSDWGSDQSPMIMAAQQGQTACLRMAISTVRFAAQHLGGFEQVPLREPASDAETSVLSYPFSA